MKKESGKIKMIRKSGLLSLLLIAILFIQSASATLEMLPESSYAAEEGNWQGSRSYDRLWGDGYLFGRVDFAVYDTENLQSAEETAFADEVAGVLDMQKQYIYAYQIFNDESLSDEIVAYFAVFGVDRDIFVEQESIGSLDDGGGGTEPSDEYFDSDESRVVWEFYGNLIYKGDHSWFLITNSEFAPIVGDYEIRGLKEDFPAPDVPEPATIALLSIGSAVLLTRQRRAKHS